MKTVRLLLLFLWPLALAAEKQPAEHRLNNLVVEILNLNGPAARSFQKFKFTQPADGWIFLSARSNPQAGSRLFLSFDDETNDRLGLSLNEKNAAGDRQNFLSAGEHTLKLDTAGGASLTEIIVRRVPELTYSKFGATPRILSAGDHDWDFLDRFIFPHLNTLVAINQDRFLPQARQWKSRGGRWLLEVSRPANPADLLKNFGMSSPYIDGLFIDEFRPDMDHLEAWKKFLPEFDPGEKDVRLYFSNEPHDPNAFGSKQKIVWEKYFGEPLPGEDPAALIQRDLGKWMTDLREQHPDIIARSTLCLGFASTYPFTLNRSSDIDIKAWLDRQFQFVATDPAYLGLPGLMEYQSRCVDDETFRWTALLFRHYGLEGKTNLLSTEFGFTEKLRHIQNGDFQNKLDHWTVQPEGAPVSAEKVPKLAYWQGHYPYRDILDHAMLVNATNGVITVSQSVENLSPGRWYSAKLTSIKQKDILTGQSEAAFNPVQIQINGAAPLIERATRDLIASPAGGARVPFTGEKPLWIDLQQIVFRADTATARLEIKVEKNPEPLLIDFVEVQPYLPR